MARERKCTSVSFVAQRSKSNRSMYTNKIIYSLHDENTQTIKKNAYFN